MTGPLKGLWQADGIDFPDKKSKHCTKPLRKIYSLHANPLARSLGQVKIMKKFVCINIIFFLNLAFEQVGGKY
jgi:hypothetical protein